MSKPQGYDAEWKRKARLNPGFKEKELEINKQWRSRNKYKISEQKKAYYLEKKEELQVLKKQRYHERRKRFVQFDKELTDLVYQEARHLAQMRSETTGVKWSVDHIIPLVGKNVSGLHVWSNLQVIPLSVNHAKYNKVQEEVGTGYRDVQ